MKPILLLLAAVPLFAQNSANVMPSPLFQALDANGNPVPLAHLCTYYASTNTLAPTYADAGGIVQNPNPIIMNGAGQALIYGSGNYKFVLTQPGGPYCPGTGALIWTVNNYQVQSQNAEYNSVTAVTFTSTATGTTPAFTQTNGLWGITGAGNANLQAITGTTITLSATGPTQAVASAGGTFNVTGAGNATFLSSTSTYAGLTGLTADPTAPGTGTAFIDYNTTTGTLNYNLGGAGWVPISVPGATTEVIYNNAGGFGAKSTMTFATDTLTLSGASTTGVVAPVFNSSNTGSNNSFQTAGGQFYVTGAGDGYFQQVITAQGFGTGNNGNTDVSGRVTLSGGTYSALWPSGHTYTYEPRCFTNDITGLHVSTAGTTNTTLTILGNGADQVDYFCVFTVY